VNDLLLLLLEFVELAMTAMTMTVQVTASAVMLTFLTGAAVVVAAAITAVLLLLVMRLLAILIVFRGLWICGLCGQTIANHCFRFE